MGKFVIPPKPSIAGWFSTLVMAVAAAAITVINLFSVKPG